MAATLIHLPNADPLALILKGLSSDNRCLLSFVLEPEGQLHGSASRFPQTLHTNCGIGISNRCNQVRAWDRRNSSPIAPFPRDELLGFQAATPVLTSTRARWAAALGNVT